ncbi:heavy-metal-associated domain-containing protein [Desulfatirhabdium butyrativorans]|uniref:heavy-metal-associated domain-containing protein n=1 Tax=Desulfatirhabdium butyrativorans TaxID=340467 RepID=UPI0003F68F79|nr:heavy-metal-associated domain-containing protein [Desulfatirhabdium butyrativorans]
MQKKQFIIPNISCGHCVRTITNELAEIQGVSAVSGNPESKEITVEFEDALSVETILATLKEIGYPAQ